MAEYPDDVLIKLQDDFSDKELIGALERLRQDASLREHVGMAAQRYIAEFHNPERIGEQYYETIESFAGLSQHTRYRSLLNSLANLTTPLEPSAADLLVTAETTACNTRQVRQKYVFVDVSVLARQDVRTGIQRVTRSVLLQLLNSPPENYRVEPVYCDEGMYRYARHFTTEVLGVVKTGLQDDRIDVQRGDVFLGLDLDSNDVPRTLYRLALRSSLQYTMYCL
jgi:hypothetical protein